MYRKSAALVQADERVAALANAEMVDSLAAQATALGSPFITMSQVTSPAHRRAHPTTAHHLLLCALRRQPQTQRS